MTKTSARYSPEVRARAVRMLLDHQADHPSRWAAISSIAAKIGCTPETLRKWVRETERDIGQRPGLTSDELARRKALERENRQLRQANEILRKWRASGRRIRRFSDVLAGWIFPLDRSSGGFRFADDGATRFRAFDIGHEVISFPGSNDRWPAIVPAAEIRSPITCATRAAGGHQRACAERPEPAARTMEDF